MNLEPFDEEMRTHIIWVYSSEHFYKCRKNYHQIWNQKREGLIDGITKLQRACHICDYCFRLHFLQILNSELHHVKIDYRKHNKKVGISF